MKKHHFFIVPIISILLLFVSGCAGKLRTSIIPPQGIIFTHIKAPCSTKYNNTHVGGRKICVDSAAQYLWDPLFGTTWGWGNAGIQTIAKHYGIKKIEYVDYEYLNVLFGLYKELVIIPHGQPLTLGK